MSKVIQRIPVIGGTPKEVECVVQEAGLRELRNWHRFIHDPYIAPDLERLDRSWSWPRYLMASYVLNDLSGRLTQAFQLVVASPLGRSVPVGQAMLVSGYTHPGEAGARGTFIWFLSSTPLTALKGMGITQRFVVMPLLLDTAVQASKWQGLGGRIALHADHHGTTKQQKALVERYRRCGMENLKHLNRSWLSFLRVMDDRYFVYNLASAHACTLRWDHLR